MDSQVVSRTEQVYAAWGEPRVDRMATAKKRNARAGVGGRRRVKVTGLGT